MISKFLLILCGVSAFGMLSVAYTVYPTPIAWAVVIVTGLYVYAVYLGFTDADVVGYSLQDADAELNGTGYDPFPQFIHQLETIAIADAIYGWQQGKLTSAQFGRAIQLAISTHPPITLVDEYGDTGIIQPITRH